MPAWEMLQIEQTAATATATAIVVARFISAPFLTPLGLLHHAGTSTPRAGRDWFPVPFHREFVLRAFLRRSVADLLHSLIAPIDFVPPGRQRPLLTCSAALPLYLIISFRS
jgi:hypothetical protein